MVTDEFSVGGGVEHIYQIVKGMPDLQFAVFGEPGPAAAKFGGLDNVDVCDKGYAPATVLEKKPDLVHIHHLKPLTAFFKNPFKRYGVPVMYTAHGLHIHKFEFYGAFSAKVKYWLRFRLEKRILPKARKVIAVSREDKMFMESNYRLGNVTYLSNGIDIAAILAAQQGTDSKAQLRERLGLPGDAFLFITVARFNFQKGYDILLRALACIRDVLEKHPCRFVLVGDGPEFDAMKRLGRELDVDRFVMYLGSRSDVYDILRAGDVFLLPSRWEGLPIVLIEAGLMKLPVVASSTYGNREIIGQDCGVLFENLNSGALASAIKDVLTKTQDMASLGERLYREVQANYSLDTMLSGLREIYVSGTESG